MDPAAKDPRVLYGFWIACALALLGGVAPLLFGPGTNSRLAGVIIPFAVAAAAFAADALMYEQGRPLAATLYFIGGIAIVYGILAMLAVPLRLAVIGTCPAPPAPCAPGFEAPLTAGETNGMNVALGAGLLAIFAGFFALVVLYRKLSRSASSISTRSIWPSQPPAAATPTPLAAPPEPPKPPEPAAAEPPAAPVAPANPEPPPSMAIAPSPAAPAPPKAATPRPKRAPRPRSPRTPKSLPAPEDLPELPAPAAGDEPGAPP